MLSIENFKKTMINKALNVRNIGEDFGQKEIRELKDRYKYNPYGNAGERMIAKQIDQLEIWAMNFDLSQI